MLAIKRSADLATAKNLKNIVVLLNLVSGSGFKGDRFGY